MATTSSITIEATWDAALAAYNHAKAEDAAIDEIFRPVAAQRESDVDAVPIEELPGDDYAGRKRCTSSADRAWWIRYSARRVEEWDAGKITVEDHIRDDFEQHIAVCRAVVQIDVDYKAAVKAIEDRLSFKELEQRWEDLGQALYDCRWALLDTPAPTLAALLWKLEGLLEPESDGSTASWSANAIAQTMADARRLLSTGRA